MKAYEVKASKKLELLEGGIEMKKRHVKQVILKNCLRRSEFLSESLLLQ